MRLELIFIIVPIAKPRAVDEIVVCPQTLTFIGNARHRHCEWQDIDEQSIPDLVVDFCLRVHSHLLRRELIISKDPRKEDDETDQWPDQPQNKFTFAQYRSKSASKDIESRGH
jgi:hypothetical protein